MACAVMQPKGIHTRREALAVGLAIAGCCGAAQAQAPAAPRNLRPLAGDLLVSAKALDAGPLRPGDIAASAPQLLAWAKDPASGAVRDGSRLNQVLLLRLDPESLDAETLARAADGVLAYSATCTHAQCPVSEWRQEAGILHCPCHGSEFDPRAGGRVVNGPALRHLPPLPLRLSADGGLEVAQPFVGKVGGQVA
jgi:rieske iron-sulfur protein